MLHPARECLFTFSMHAAPTPHKHDGLPALPCDHADSFGSCRAALPIPEAGALPATPQPLSPCSLPEGLVAQRASPRNT